MKRRQFLESAAYAGLIGLSPNLSEIWKSFMAHGYKMKVLRGNVGIFTERGGTIGWLIDKESSVVVDSQFPDQAKHVLEEIQERGNSTIEYLINTHHHRDHTAGNPVFKGIAKHILAHENSKINQQKSAEQRGTTDEQVYPDETFSREWAKPVANEQISLSYHGAAHTNGDAIIHFENVNIVHMGDLIFNRRHPYIDKGAGASIENWINVLETASRNFDDDTLFIFGHAGDGYEVTGGLEDINAFAHYLQKLLDFVGAEMKSGKTLEQMLESSKIIPGAEEWKGGGIERVIKAAHMELSE